MSTLATMPLTRQNRALFADYGVDERALVIPENLKPIMPAGIQDEMMKCLHEAIAVLQARELYRPRFEQKYAERFDHLCSAGGEIYKQHMESVRAIQHCVPPRKIPKNMVHLTPFGHDYGVFVYRENMALKYVELGKLPKYNDAVDRVEAIMKDELVGDACMASLSWWRSVFLGEMRKLIHGRERMYMPTQEATVKEFCELIRERVEDGDQVAERFEREAGAY
ncbi:hypothetical protein BO94DRAFT_616177 [Aspergillus sclerotioniger CBS 115572]|uniref:Uncharacterized protein n=1 Tax=Aspergillus sclerotioniger CBS 115572 TaxID=1450535 RepID=A0A317X4J6_9EURO|nr:hypothetical protein BO94DRAFT_616177 [Aspergillus sclerotioniger CBS 115572]PWY93265.1 hypothetical protein BO94DRAFT_616177 [Aspergillus sclerotioniger CBS 115572]